MDAADGEISDQEDFDIADDYDQDEYFPFDDEPAGPYAAMPVATVAGGPAAGGAHLQPSSNLPISSSLISNLNQNVLMQQQASHHATSQMTAYQFQVMQSSVLAQEMAMMNQNATSVTHGLGYIPGAAAAMHAPGQPSASGLPGGWSSFGPSALVSTGSVGTPGAAAGTAGFSVAHSAPAQAAQHLMFAQMHRPVSSWDPSGSKDWDATKPSDLCLGRIARDLHSLYTDPIPGIMVHANENDVTRMLALIKGPTDTPYEGGFFQFFLRCPPDYPISNPRVKLLTTGGGTVRFNPNLYANGKVCLSLLGTWAGPQWSPALNISSLLLSIQSLMCEFPYKNEPGYDQVANNNPEVLKYNLVIRHETLRVAVIDKVKEALRAETGVFQAVKLGPKSGAGDQKQDMTALPGSFRSIILRSFLENYELYLRICAKEKNSVASGTSMPAFCETRKGTFMWDDMAKEITELKSRVEFEVESLDKAGTKNGVDDGDSESDKLD